MSHSKTTKRGYSLYVESWNPSAKRFVNVCVLCGRKGYSPTIEDPGFCSSFEKKAVYAELTKIYSPLPLDEFGRCDVCRKLTDEQK